MSSHNDEIDKNLLEFARQVAAIPRQISEGARVANATPQPPMTSNAAPPAPIVVSSKSEPKSEPKSAPPPQTALPDEPQKKSQTETTSNKKLRTPNELANLVMTTLREVGDCPPKGFVVTIYGSNPWNAMLMIRPEAGTRIDRSLWISRVQDIAARLRNEFDIADDTSPS